MHAADSGTTEIRAVPVDPLSLLEKCAQRHGADPAADGPRIVIEFGDAETAKPAWRTDPDIVEAILRNLLQNATTYAPPGSRVAVSLRGDGVEIANDAPDFDSTTLERLREPFWQADPSRTEADRFGLGLTLCEAYARLLGARLDFRFDETTRRFTAAFRLVL